MGLIKLLNCRFRKVEYMNYWRRLEQSFGGKLRKTLPTCELKQENAYGIR